MEFNKPIYVYKCLDCGDQEYQSGRVRKTPYRCRDCAPTHYKQVLVMRGRSQAIAQKVIKERGSVCQECGTHKGKMHVHHIKPLCMGGSLGGENLIVLCPGCHKEKHKNGAFIADYGDWVWRIEYVVKSI